MSFSGSWKQNNFKVVILFTLIFFCLVTEHIPAQTVIQLSPGLYCAGIPSKEFEYFAAPETSGKQRQSNWCWAACIQMILNYHGVSVTQEQIVRRVFGNLIDLPAGPDVILATLTGWAVNSRGRNVIITATPFIFNGSEIIYDLAYHWPLIIGLTVPGSIGHACVLTAVTYEIDPYTNEPIFQSVVIRDPWPGHSSRTEISWMEFSQRLTFIARVRVAEQ